LTPWPQWLEKLKAAFLDRVKSVHYAAWKCGVEAEWILDTEPLEAARAEKMFSVLDPANGVQGNKDRAAALVKGWLTTIAYVDLQEPDPVWQAKYAAAHINNGNDQIPGAEVPATKPAPVVHNSALDVSWREYLMTIPPKGVKKADYKPEPLGVLYDLAEQGDQGAGKRLFGHAAHLELKGWIDREGKTRPPSEEDRTLRRGLDLFQAWHKAKDEVTP
jgi:hypothetical protein